LFPCLDEFVRDPAHRRYHDNRVSLGGRASNDVDDLQNAGSVSDGRTTKFQNPEWPGTDALRDRATTVASVEDFVCGVIHGSNDDSAVVLIDLTRSWAWSMFRNFEL
jgi:hypothetical protein